MLSDNGHLSLYQRLHAESRRKKTVLGVDIMDGIMEPYQDNGGGYVLYAKVYGFEVERGSVGITGKCGGLHRFL